MIWRCRIRVNKLLLFDYVHFCESPWIMYVKRPPHRALRCVQTNDLRTEFAKSSGYVRKSPCNRKQKFTKVRPHSKKTRRKGESFEKRVADAITALAACQ